jgi:two-component system cell cycle sensor histidine kinase/response regulator CckA
MSADTIDRVIAHRITLFIKTTSMCAVTIGALALVGWIVNARMLKSILPGLASMKANTAFCILLLGVSLWFSGAHSPRFDRIESKRMGMSCAFFATLLSFLTLCEYIFGLNLRIDQLLFRDVSPDGLSVPGRMAPHTAVALFILGCALLLRAVETKRGFRPAQFLGLVPAAISLVAIAGYLYSVVSLYRIASYTGMALHTAVAIFLLSVGVILTPPDRGIAAIVSSAGLGGVVVRRLLPAAFLVPLGIGWIRMEGQKAGFCGTEFGLALMATSCVLVFSVVIYLSGVQVQKIDDARRAAEQGVLELNYTLSALVDVFPLPVIFLTPDAKIRLWNAATERVFGWPWLQVRNKRLPLVPDDRLAEFQTIFELLETGESVTGIKTELCTRDDIRIPVALWAAPIEIGKHGFSGSILVLDDMNKGKELENQLREARTALAMQTEQES